MALIRLENISKAFRRRGKHPAPPAISDLTIEVDRGKTLAIVGESGAGKSTAGRVALHLIKPDAGHVTFDGTDLGRLSSRGLRRLRPRMQMIFQDPTTSIDPRMTVGKTVEEPLIVHRRMSSTERRVRVEQLLKDVGLSPTITQRFPRELSGGQLQRISIAKALATDPELLVCDEPTSALDLSIAAQITNLLLELQQARDLTMIYISHDLRMVSVVADTVAVMLRGQLVENGEAHDLLGNPQQEYTKALLAAVPGGKLTLSRAKD